jgi:hypothetical protein
MSNPKRSPKRSPRSSPKPRTPTLKTIANDLANGLKEVKEVLPAGGIATLGLKAEDVQVLIDYPNILRGFLIIGAIVVYTLCVVFFLEGHEGVRDNIQTSIPGKIPGYIFSPWFVIILLTASMAGFVYILFALNTFSFFFTVVAILYLVSMVLLFDKFYSKSSPMYGSVFSGTSAPQIFAFIVFISVFAFGMIVTQETNNFLFSLAALFPTLLFTAFMVYYTGKVNV